LLKQIDLKDTGYKNIRVVNVAVVRIQFFANLSYAVFASGNWLIKDKFRALRRLVGKSNLRKEVIRMVMTDPVADMLTRIRNANAVRHESLEVPGSRLKREIAEILKREGFIKEVEYVEDNKQGMIRIFLKYGPNQEKVITGLKRISKPGLRVYAKADEVPRVLSGLGIAIVSTSTGIITDKEARKQSVGGEVLAYVW
jgi:small subunit ribosomal protein S8